MNETLLILGLVLGLAAALPTKNLKTLRTCKNTASNGRLGIYDGKSTTIDKHNYLVGIVVDGGFSCAGAIVSESYVLTVGDCAVDLSASEISVVVGSSDGTSGTSFSVDTIVLNPGCREPYLGSYDFALLKVDGTFTWGKNVGNVSLPDANPKSGAALVAVGYGDTSFLGFVGEGTLMQGTMKYVTAAHCESYYSYADIPFDASMACAYNKGKTTMCDYDFGNPFTKGRVLYGLMAVGGAYEEFCDSSAIPVIIANVYTVVDWINKYIY